MDTDLMSQLSKQPLDDYRTAYLHDVIEKLELCIARLGFDQELWARLIMVKSVAGMLDSNDFDLRRAKEVIEYGFYPGGFSNKTSPDLAGEDCLFVGGWRNGQYKKVDPEKLLRLPISQIIEKRVLGKDPAVRKINYRRIKIHLDNKLVGHIYCAEHVTYGDVFSNKLIRLRNSLPIHYRGSGK